MAESTERRYRKRLRLARNIVLMVAFVVLSGTTTGAQQILELSNRNVRARIQSLNGMLLQEFYAASLSGWELIATSSSDRHSQNVPLYSSQYNEASRYLLSKMKVLSVSRKRIKGADAITVAGHINGARINLVISVSGEEEYFHIEVETAFDKDNPELEYILSDYVFHAQADVPEFVHTPALKFQPEDVIGDRSFWSPAIIMQHERRFVALVPDLNMINKHQVATPGARPVATGTNFSIPIDSSKITLPTGLDVRTDLQGEKEMALFSYGFIDAIASHHMHWRHPNDSSMVRTVPSKVLKYGFDLFVGAQAQRYTGYQKVSQYIWSRYGTGEFNKAKSLAMPFEGYAQICYPASKNYKGSRVEREDGRLIAVHSAPHNNPELDSWLEWESEGLSVGGYRNNAPQWYDMIGNTAWWNNVRDAVGMFRWGKMMEDSILIERSKRVINLALQAPQNDGAFPVIFRFNEKKWIGNHWSPPTDIDSARVERYFNDESESYHTSSMSKTSAHLLRYYLHCEKRQEIVSYAERYADFLIRNMDGEGCIPSFFNRDLTPNPHLQKNGAGGVHAWFLATLYRITKKTEHLAAAIKAASYVETHILPAQDWKDYEVYFSCGVKPLSFYDKYSGQGPRNTLSMHWALEGFLALFDATSDEKYLRSAALVADYLSLYQAAWQPHFITTAYAFGGFGVQNTDAEWLDARQGEIAPAFVRLGTLTGRKDLIERGIAAAKASLVLVNHERHIKNNIYAYPNFPFGLGPENIDHEGRPQSPMRTNAGWGEVSGLSGVADILHQIGDLYVDGDGRFAVGVNGIRVVEMRAAENGIKLKVENTLSQLVYPFEDTLEVDVKVGSKEVTPSKEVSVRKAANIRITGYERATLEH